MRVESLTIRHFRAIDEMDLVFPERLTVFIGGNGSGKTSILDCLAVLLSQVTARIESLEGTGYAFEEADITSGERFTESTGRVRLDGDEVTVRLAKHRRGTLPEAATDVSQLEAAVRRLVGEIQSDERASLPLAVYYPTDRAAVEAPDRPTRAGSMERIAAYDKALFGGREDFTLFFEWFREHEDLENQMIARRQRGAASSAPEMKHLDAVRKAIAAFLPGFSDLRIERYPNVRMVADKGRHEVTINRMSDGEKCLLALVGDLARRLAMANPGLEDPLQGAGVVLIDEVELHLHPEWQRIVIPNLEKTFPNCQFIVTTHSPQVLSHVAPEKVYVVRESEGAVVVSRPEATYGQSSNRILEDVMGVSSRPNEVRDRLKALFDTIDKGEVRQAKALAEEIRALIGDDPDLVRADMLIRRREITGR